MWWLWHALYRQIFGSQVNLIYNFLHLLNKISFLSAPFICVDRFCLQIIDLFVIYETFKLFLFAHMTQVLILYETIIRYQYKNLESSFLIYKIPETLIYFCAYYKMWILWLTICVLSTHSSIKPDVLFHHHDTEHCDYTILLYKYINKKTFLYTGRCETFLLVFGIYPSGINQPWDQSMLTSLSCCNQPLLQKHIQVCSHQNSWEAFILTNVIRWKIIGPLYINYCWLISTFLHQCYSIYTSLKHTNEPSKH